MSTANRIILWRTRHDRRTFVESLPFVTGTGKVDRVVTPLCIFRRDPAAGRLVLESVHPYTTAGEVADQTGFPLDLADVPATPPPTPAELEALERIDPQGIRRTEFAG